MASIAALSVKSNLPSVAVRLFTHGAWSYVTSSRKSPILSDVMMPAGQPRTGDAAYADLLETTVGRDHVFRGRSFLASSSCHSLLTYAVQSRTYVGYRPSNRFHAADDLLNAFTTDGVPTMIPESLGYHHQYVCSTFSLRLQSNATFHTTIARASIGNLMNRVSRPS